MHLTCHPRIAAIYFALHHCGYAFERPGRDAAHLRAVRLHAGTADVPVFFSAVKQSTCEVYPYWPRAAILEAAVCHLRDDGEGYRSEAALQAHIRSAANITDAERDERLWAWLSGFPAALHAVLDSSAFQHYLAWLQAWTVAQQAAAQPALSSLSRSIDWCRRRFPAPVQDIQIVIDPIKCIYSADHHLMNGHFLFCSGRMQAASILHELLHPLVHPMIQPLAPAILETPRSYPELDASYLLAGDAAGQLNAFEEHAVRHLTADLLQQQFPSDLSHYLLQLLEQPIKGAAT